VTLETALRPSHFFGTSAQLRQKLQAQYELEVASHRIGKRVKRGIRPLSRPVLARQHADR
jgi:plasmid maintenance system antidote protein VapI